MIQFKKLAADTLESETEEEFSEAESEYSVAELVYLSILTSTARFKRRRRKGFRVIYG